MGFFSRVRLLIGILIVIAVVGLLVAYLNYAMSHITSQSATLDANSYAVTSQYGGIVAKQYVDVGETVRKGDRLFEVSSPTLRDSLRNKRTSRSSLIFPVTKSGNILVTATNPGTISQVTIPTGAYLPDNGQLALIDTANTRYVTAKFLLRAPDYARIDRSQPLWVTLPDNRRVETKIFDISLRRDGENIYTVVKARVMDQQDINPTFTTGTPVSAEWELRNDNWLNSSIEFVKNLFAPALPKV